MIKREKERKRERERGDKGLLDSKAYSVQEHGDETAGVDNGLFAAELRHPSHHSDGLILKGVKTGSVDAWGGDIFGHDPTCFGIEMVMSSDLITRTGVDREGTLYTYEFRCDVRRKFQRLASIFSATFDRPTRFGWSRD